MTEATAMGGAREAARSATGEIWLCLDSGGVGGVETHVRALYVALKRAGAPARIVLFKARAGNPWLDQIAAAGAEPLILDGGVGALIRALRTRRPAVLHTHGYKADILGRIAARLTATPVVSTFHAGERAPGRVGWYQRVDEWTSFLGRRIAVSAPIQALLPFPATHIPNFIAAPPEASTAPLPPRIAFVGRLSPEKGPDLFCRLAAELGAMDVEWRVYGAGPMRAELEGAYGAHVRFCGVATNMDAVWPEIGLLAMTSRAEGLPMAALEAGAAGAPILASRVGALPEVIAEGETGWLVDPAALEAGDFSGARAAIEAWRARIEDAAASQALRADCWGRIRAHYSETVALQRIRAEYVAAGMSAD